MTGKYEGTERRLVHVKDDETGRVLYDGPERRVTPRDAAFDRAVEAAATAASRQVMVEHRRATVRQTAMLCVLLTLAVSLVVGLVFRNDANSLTTATAQYDCRLVKDMSASVSDFVQLDVQLRAAQAKSSVTTRLVKDLAKVLPGKDLITASNQSNNENNAVVAHWEKVDLPALQTLARSNCSLLR